MDDDSSSGADASRVTARRSALKKLGAGAAAVWVAPAITTGASAGQVASPAPGTCVGTEAELLAALAAATAGSTITLCATTIVLSATISIDTGVALVSQGPGAATLSGDGTGDLLLIQPGTTVTLDNIKITGGTVGNGGTLTFTGCVVDDAAGGVLPAIRSNGALTATNTTFSNNAATAFGGAISTSSGTLTLTNCTFSGNSAGDGGAVHLSSTTATITNCAFVANAAVNDGGAIIAAGTSTFSTPGCVFSGNSADPGLGAGGAVRHAASGLYTVGSATFTANNAGIGTAIYRGTNPINLAGATFSPGQTVVNP